MQNLPTTLADNVVRRMTAAGAMLCRPGMEWLSWNHRGACLPVNTHLSAFKRACRWVLGNVTTFMAMRWISLGTRMPALFKSMRCVGAGWRPAHPSEIFLVEHRAVLGTTFAPLVHESPTASKVPGWCSMLRSANFTRVATSPAPSGAYHLPVFPVEVAEWMAAGPNSFIIDGTLGDGGHSEIFLKAGARVLGIDRDPDALARARARFAGVGDRFETWEGNFAQLRDIPVLQHAGAADGLLLDLGVSSQQLDTAARGFSFQREGPLDMRMGPSCRHTAADLVNGWPEADLARMLIDVGEEFNGRRIAAAIVKRRSQRAFETTTDLAACIEKVMGRRGRIHPATRTFQAIRMTVNEELESLTSALAAAPGVLKSGAVIVLITFHSLEDRIVKRFLRYHSTPFIDNPGWPEARPNLDYKFRMLARKAITPTAAETARNPRARSAKLRIAQILD